MLIPWLDGICGPLQAPVTWILFALCLSTYVLTSAQSEKSDADIQIHLENSHYLESQSYLYAKFILQRQEEYSTVLIELANQVFSGRHSQQDLLGHLALRDQNFLSHYLEVQSEDPIAVASVRRHLAAIEKIDDLDPIHNLGVFVGQTQLRSLLTYMFTHSGMTHLLGNMFFLLLFGCFLERKQGGLLVLIVFLGTGALGALVFLLATGPTLAPLVGASGAISGLMGFCCAYYLKHRVRFFYWLFLPGKKYSGTILLPIGLVFAFWVCADLSGALSSMSEIGGVAYYAHLGGEFFGVLLATTILSVQSLDAKYFQSQPADP
jgi:membrane associated rhomboid family serine protease